MLNPSFTTAPPPQIPIQIWQEDTDTTLSMAMIQERYRQVGEHSRIRSRQVREDIIRCMVMIREACHLVVSPSLLKFFARFLWRICGGEKSMYWSLTHPKRLEGALYPMYIAVADTDLRRGRSASFSRSRSSACVDSCRYSRSRSCARSYSPSVSASASTAISTKRSAFRESSSCQRRCQRRRQPCAGARSSDKSSGHLKYSSIAWIGFGTKRRRIKFGVVDCNFVCNVFDGDKFCKWKW